MIILAHDFETTGLDTAKCGVVQYAIGVLEILSPTEVQLLEHQVGFCNPGEPIPAVCTKVHGIKDEDVAGSPHYMQELNSLYAKWFSKYPIELVMGYNNREYDDRIARRCGMPARPSFDLYDYGREVKNRKLIDKAKLTSLYEYMTDKPLSGAHDAWVDIAACIELLPYLANEFGHTTLQEMIEFTTPKIDPSLPITFGKHKGTPLSQLPASYVNWLLKNTYSLPRDITATLRALRG